MNREIDNSVHAHDEKEEYMSNDSLNVLSVLLSLQSVHIILLLNVWECVKPISFISAWCGEPTLLKPLHWLADSCSDTDHCHCRKLNSNSNKIILGTAVESLHIYKQYQLCAISFNTVQFHAMSNDSSTPYDEVLFAETIFSRATIHCFASLSSITQCIQHMQQRNNS